MVDEEQDRVVVVLVRARNPANIGAVARGMHDLGFSQLRVVNEYPVPFAAAKSAVHASWVLERAVEAASVAEAVADCTLVLGTTAVGERKLKHPLYTLADAVPVIHDALRASGTAKVALLFGSEKTGLSNDELSHCHALLTIPMNTRTADRHLSMNLGQAAAVCLYAITEGGGAVRASAVDEPATGGDLERLTGLLGEVLEQSGYTRKHPANSREANVRRMVRRMGNSSDDAAVWSGVLRQLLHALEGSTHAGRPDGGQ
jgi:tRNA/rRNA methyltransferase